MNCSNLANDRKGILLKYLPIKLQNTGYFALCHIDNIYLLGNFPESIKTQLELQNYCINLNQWLVIPIHQEITV